MEYNITDFTTQLRNLMYARFPYEHDSINLQKHKKRPKHIRDIAFMENEVMNNGDTTIFEIGNEQSESEYPYYHILEDAPVIRKRGKGTAKTKGTQEMIKEKGKRDYGYVYWNGKTFTKEYSRNVRGSRKRLSSVSHWTTDYMGNDLFINREANSYLNVHYQYIEKMLNNGILDEIATMFNLKRARTVNSGLVEEFADQENVSVDAIMEVFGSFMG